LNFEFWIILTVHANSKFKIAIIPLLLVGAGFFAGAGL
jgi:hypothetical protein